MRSHVASIYQLIVQYYKQCPSSCWKLIRTILLSNDSTPGGLISLVGKTIPLDYWCLGSLRSIPAGKQCELYCVCKQKYSHIRPSCWEKWVPGFTPWESEECLFACGIRAEATLNRRT
ncbi:hypothetical protein BsWGS_04828 [Bradybaena similaris]